MITANKEIKNRADELLIQIAGRTERLEAACAKYQDELQVVKDRHQDAIVGLEDLIASASGELLTLMKKNTTEIFEGESRVELENGSLLFTIEERVKKARGVLEKLEELGFEEGIERSAKVNWDELEKWPVERLVLVGTERKRKEVFSWEIRERCT